LHLKLQQYLPNENNIFNDEVTIKTKKGEELKMNLVVSELKKYSNHTLFVGTFYSLSTNFVPSIIPHLADEVYSLLKRENVRISDRTVEKFRTKLMSKSGANNMIEVIVFALKNNLIEI
jgi:hypothetical protein